MLFLNKLYDLLNFTRSVDFLAPLMMRIYLFFPMWDAGTRKLSDIEGIAAWFGNEDWGLGLPMPYLLAILATAAEVLGALALLFGAALRWMCIPLMITMIVAATTAHWENGWPAVAPSAANPICIEGSNEAKAANPVQKFTKCYNSNERTVASADRLDRAKSILREHGNYDWLAGHGSFVVLNNGIEFAVTYFIMLLALFFMGAGRFFSVDYWFKRSVLKRQDY